MASIESKSMDTPDESRTPDKTNVSVVHLGQATVARLTAQPGWRWSECIKPVVGGESCQALPGGAPRLRGLGEDSHRIERRERA